MKSSQNAMRTHRLSAKIKTNSSQQQKKRWISDGRKNLQTKFLFPCQNTAFCHTRFTVIVSSILSRWMFGFVERVVFTFSQKRAMISRTSSCFCFPPHLFYCCTFLVSCVLPSVWKIRLQFMIANATVWY